MLAIESFDPLYNVGDRLSRARANVEDVAILVYRYVD